MIGWRLAAWWGALALVGAFYAVLVWLTVQVVR